VSWIGHALIYVELLAVIGLLAAGAVMVWSTFALLFQRAAGSTRFALLLSVLFVPSFAIGLMLRTLVCNAYLLRVTERAQPLVSAVAEYRADRGHPPASLDDLVPLYLDQIPRTGIGAWPEFSFFAGVPESYDGNEWVLMATPPCAAWLRQVAVLPAAELSRYRLRRRFAADRHLGLGS
jgi:hypothetical protein